MESLPIEIIQQILENSVLNIIDIVNFSSTSSKFRQMINSNRSLWKRKYFQRWPKSDFIIICEDWYNEFIFRLNFEKDLKKLLSTMSSKFFHLNINDIGYPQLDFIDSLVNSHQSGYYYLRDFLLKIHLLPSTQSLTDKYYGNILMKHAHKKHCRKIWNSLMELSPQKHVLEKGAIFVSVWCQEYERGIAERVVHQLDETANKIKQCLLQFLPNHPLHHVPLEVQLTWRYKIIPGNYFNPKDCESIIEMIKHVLFNDLNYYITHDFNDFDKKQCGIDCALLDRKANPYIFCVIFESLARRLGVKLEILDFPDDCLLRWKENYSITDSCSHFIKLSPNRIFKTYVWPKNQRNQELMSPCNLQKLAQRLAQYIRPREPRENWFLLKDALELQLVIKPVSLECYQQLSQIHMLYELDAKDLISKLKSTQNQISNLTREFQSLLLSLQLYQEIWEDNHESNQSQPLIVQNRMEGINFAVGMIVRDKVRELAGVIYEWDVEIAESKKSSKKVYYKILIEDGRYQCMSQENLQILHSPPFVCHPSLGRFFDEYCMSYFKPNKELQAHYPQDMEALQKILKNDRL